MFKPSFRLILIGFAATLALPLSAQNRERITCFTTYDEDFFYLAAVVQKPNLVAKNVAPFSNPVADDAVAVFLQKGEAAAKRSPDSVQMAVSAGGGAQIYRGADAAPLAGFQDFKTDPAGSRVPFKYRAVATEDLNRPGGPATSYTVEMAIPWLELGGAPKPGNRLRFNVVAFSAAPGSAPIVSLSPRVKTAEDLQNPSLWTEIAFVDAAVRQIEGAPDVRISPRVFSQKPLIDGIVSPGEWNSLTSFNFGEGAGGEAAAGFTPNAASGRARPKVALSKAPPRIPAAPRPAVRPPARRPQAVPRLVFALYDCAFQADPRKKLPLNSPRRPDGASLLVTHPLDGEGPWMTYDRVDWHLQNAEQMKQAGIDVMAVVYRADADSDTSRARRGLLALASALRTLQSAGRPHPLVAPVLDTESLFPGLKLDMKAAAGQSRLYRAVREVFLHLPPALRLAVPLESGPANVMVLSSAAPFAGIDGAALDYCRSRFLSDFGQDLIILGPSELKPANLDGYVADTAGGGFRMDGSGWIKPASIGTGVEGAPGKDQKPRRDGETYRADWQTAIDRQADWIFIDGWNDFRQGSEVAPTIEHGMRYSDLTRLMTRAFSLAGPHKGSVGALSLPDFLPVSSTASLSVRLQNNDSTAWAPDKYVMVYLWRRAGAPVGPPRTVPLPESILPGQSQTVSFLTPTPAQPGEFELAVDVAPLDKKGALGPGVGGGAPLLTKRIRIGAPEEKSASQLSVGEPQTDLPLVLESGGTYSARVTLRNTGSAVWKKDDRVTARLDRLADALEPVEIADASAAFPADVAPGQEVTVSIPITLGSSDAEPLPLSSTIAGGSYVLSFEVAAGGAGASTPPQAVLLVDKDLGAVFSSVLMPPQLPAGRSLPVRMTLRNNGPQAWLKESAAVGYHWYFMDGVEAQWDGQTTPLPRDLEPGGEIADFLAFVTPPPGDGRYWLVWDIKIGDTWVSTQPGIRSGETRVFAVEVVKGNLAYVDLARAYNVDGISADTDRSDGNLDSGRTLPAEQVPPFATGDVVPSTLWLPNRGVGFASSRGIGFKWGGSGLKTKNIVQAVGQKVPLLPESGKPDVYKTLHLLAASTKELPATSFLVEFADGTQQLSSFPLSRWDAPPVNEEEIAFAVTRTHTPAGEDPKSVHFYRYTIRIAEPKKVAALILPNQPEIKIAAITLEK